VGTYFWSASRLLTLFGFLGARHCNWCNLGGGHAYLQEKRSHPSAGWNA
jgi:hypothetical protein